MATVMSSDLSKKGTGTATATSTNAVQRSPGKRTMVDSQYGAVQRKGGAGDKDSDAIHAAADAGISGAGGALPFADQIQSSFGSHDISGIRAHTGGAAAEASASMGAQAYAKGSDIAFAGTPDLHTAAHEAAHVVQQRAGVHLKGGVGEAGDTYERHADAVADAVVRGESAEGLLSEMTGGAPAGGASVQKKAVQFIGTPLDKPLPPGAETPKFGEDPGEQRRYSPQQYIELWEKEQGRKMTDEEKQTIKRGCIGITAANLEGGGNPLDYAEKIFGTFDQAHAWMVEQNGILDTMARVSTAPEWQDKSRYVLFAKLFWSNQKGSWEDRLRPDPKAFKPDPKTGEVDMTGYEYEPQSKWGTDEAGNRVKSSYVNFDYGFWDESTKSIWHANHMEYKDPARAAKDPMKVYQSTRELFERGYRDFDRIVWGVARAHNYNPALAAMSHASGGGG